MARFDLHLKHWPPGVPYLLNMPERSIYANLADTAARLPGKVAFHYHGRDLTFSQLDDAVIRLAGWLQKAAGVAQGDRVLLYMQNSPHFVIGYYAIMRADAVVVPVSPMNREAELRHLADDTGAAVAICGAELWAQLKPLVADGTLQRVLVGAYSDMAEPGHDLRLPEPFASLTEPADAPDRFSNALAADHSPGPHRAGAGDLALIPYSSGTTGRPKGCMHTHRSVMATAQGTVLWNTNPGRSILLGTLPLFHVTGMQNSMNASILAGDTVILMARWDRRLAARLIERHGVTRWRSITTMAIDLLNDPEIGRHDLSSLEGIGGGGAAMPAAIAQRLKDMTGLDYVEGYGMSETMAATHINPTHAARQQCLGIPVMEVDARVISLDDGRELGVCQEGEIVMHGPQVFQGYWRDPQATEAAFITIEGKRFVRSGDIGHFDADGYFYMTDRRKRMINAAGFKVWPAEVEALLLHHPDIAEACVIATPDARRGEAVKALIVLRDGAAPDAHAMTGWCRTRMAAYKCPTRIEFTDSLPKSGAGKVLWRALTEREFQNNGQETP